MFPQNSNKIIPQNASLQNKLYSVFAKDSV